MTIDAQVDEVRAPYVRTKQPICEEQAGQAREHSEFNKKEEPLPVVFLRKEMLRPVATTKTAHPRVNILGVGVSAIDLPRAVGTIESWIATRSRNYVCTATVHGIVECQHDEKLRRIYNSAGLVTPDGMPLVWLGRWKGFPRVGRVYGPDLMLSVYERSVPAGYKHFLYGGGDGVVEKLRRRLEERFPGLNIVGTHAPPFGAATPLEDEKVLRAIDATKPDAIWIGLGTPKQDRWMAAHLGRLNAPVLIGVGAAFDFHAGVKKQAPLWMRQAALEWLFRLFSEPRRLWRRYLLGNPQFLFWLLLQTFRLKQYTIEAAGDPRPR